jgi:16S rRNA G1207 methylase RsmC
LRDFPDGHFNFIDIGGGDGLFADKVLARFPNSHGTVLDNSQLLLKKNIPSSRKNIIFNSAENIKKFT